MIKDFFWWYKHLTGKGYGYIESIDYALYNCRHYDRDGNYNLEWRKRQTRQVVSLLSY